MTAGMVRTETPSLSAREGMQMIDDINMFVAVQLMYFYIQFFGF